MEKKNKCKYKIIVIKLADLQKIHIYFNLITHHEHFHCNFFYINTFFIDAFTNLR